MTRTNLRQRIRRLEEIAHRRLAGGGFSHDEHDAAGPYLGDTLAMGQAFLALHALTQDPVWLARAEASAGFI